MSPFETKGSRHRCSLSRDHIPHTQNVGYSSLRVLEADPVSTLGSRHGANWRQSGWLALGILTLAVSLGYGEPVMAQEGEVEEEVLEEGVTSEIIFGPPQAVQRRVTREVVSLCGSYRCQDYQRVVRIPVQAEDTIEGLADRLGAAMLAEVERTFGGANPPERVLVEGYLFQGSQSFRTVETPIFLLFVPRHRWVVGRFGIEQDSILFPELINRIEAALGFGVEAGDTAVPGSPQAPDLPPLPPLPPPGSAPDGQPEGTTQRTPTS